MKGTLELRETRFMKQQLRGLIFSRTLKTIRQMSLVRCLRSFRLNPCTACLLCNHNGREHSCNGSFKYDKQKTGHKDYHPFQESPFRPYKRRISGSRGIGADIGLQPESL